MLTHSKFDRFVQNARMDIAYLKLRSALARNALYQKEYNPNQRRVPAGRRDGGQWAAVEGEGGIEDQPGKQKRGQQLAQNSQEFCDEQYKRDVFQCKMVGLRSCYAQAMVSLVACERGHSIPPLNY